MIDSNILKQLQSRNNQQKSNLQPNIINLTSQTHHQNLEFPRMFPPPASLCNPRWFCLARETPWTSGSTPRGATIFIAWESCFNKQNDGSINPFFAPYIPIYMFLLNSMVNVGNYFSYMEQFGKEKSEMTIYCLRDMFLLDRSRGMMERGIRACRWNRRLKPPLNHCWMKKHLWCCHWGVGHDMTK